MLDSTIFVLKQVRSAPDKAQFQNSHFMLYPQAYFWLWPTATCQRFQLLFYGQKAYSNSQVHTEILAPDPYSDLCLGNQSLSNMNIETSVPEISLDLIPTGTIQLQHLLTTGVPSKFLSQIFLPCFLVCLCIL